jgi:two-component system, cell cycle sensor histidine kinase and response regulator CckA
MMKVLDLNAVISDTESQLRRTLGNDIRITAIFASTLAPVRADARKLQQVILRLAAHARQGMSSGGRFTVETRNVRIDPADNPSAHSNACVSLTLSNTGNGMNDAALQRVFEPVNEFDSQTIGIGLAMSMIPTILQELGGTIQVESQAGGGAAFKISLPACGDVASQILDVRGPYDIPHGNETILLVEDEDSIRSLLKILLQSCGYTVLEAISGDEAVRLAESTRGSIDLLITDIVLPRMNGKALVERLVASRPAIKVLLISGYSADRLSTLDAWQTNFAFLQKPFKCDVLGNLVRQLLDTPAKHAKIA